MREQNNLKFFLFRLDPPPLGKCPKGSRFFLKMDSLKKVLFAHFTDGRWNAFNVEIFLQDMNFEAHTNTHFHFIS